MKSMQKKKLNLKRIDSILIETPENTAETTSFSFETAISSLQDHATSSLLDISNQQYFPQSIQIQKEPFPLSQRKRNVLLHRLRIQQVQKADQPQQPSTKRQMQVRETLRRNSMRCLSGEQVFIVKKEKTYNTVNFLLSYDSIDKPKFNTGKIGTNQNTIIKINEQNREYRKAHSFIRKIESKETNRQNKSDALKNCSHRSRPLTCGKILRQRQKMNRSQELFQKQTQYCFSSPINLRPSKTIEIDKVSINFSHRGRKYLRLNRFSVNII